MKINIFKLGIFRGMKDTLVNDINNSVDLELKGNLEEAENMQETDLGVRNVVDALSQDYFIQQRGDSNG